MTHSTPGPEPVPVPAQPWTDPIPDVSSQMHPASHCIMLYVRWSVHEGCREVIRRSCPEVRECLFFRSQVAVVCLLTEGRDTARESVYVNADETPASR